MMIGGIILIFIPLINILGYVPIIGGLLKGSMFLVVGLGAVIICIPLWIITFSVAWTYYHPKIGVIFLGLGLSILIGILLYNNYKSGNIKEGIETTKQIQHLMEIWRLR
jgi:hypothetical protein